MRIRSIKPEFWASEVISGLTMTTRLTFIGLWSYVDDNGVGIDRINRIATQLFPDDVVRDSRGTLAMLTAALDELTDAGLIHRYESDGRSLLFVTSWDEHQTISRPNVPRHPRPDAIPEPPLDNTDDMQPATNNMHVAANDMQHAAVSLSGTGEQGNRGTGEQKARARKRATRAPDNFPITESMTEWAQTNTPDVDIGRETAKFLDHHAAKGSTFADWRRAWQTWMRRSAEFTPSRAGPKRTTDDKVSDALALAERLALKHDQPAIGVS